MLKKMIVTLAAVAMTGGVAAAQMDAAPEPAGEKKPVKKLGVGDPAPSLGSVTWVKGEAISNWKEGDIYVLDFWATWCGPCIASIPTIAEIQAKHEKDGVHVIGVAVWDEKSKVDRFMTTEKGQEMTYRIAFDTGEHAAADFMQAAGQGGIPTAFVIDRTGKIAWIGHPEGGLEEVLAAVIKGDFDPIKFAEEQERMMQQAQALHQRFGMAMNNEDWDSVISIADEMLALNDKWFADRAVWKYIALIKDGRVEEAKKWAAQVASTLFHKDANQLNMFSWAIVGPDSMLDEKEVDTALGLRLAERANELTKSEDASILDTVARAHYVSGDLKAAIKYQTMAVDAAGEDSPMTTSLSATLKAYTDEAGDT